MTNDLLKKSKIKGTRLQAAIAARANENEIRQ